MFFALPLSSNRSALPVPIMKLGRESIMGQVSRCFTAADLDVLLTHVVFQHKFEAAFWKSYLNIAFTIECFSCI